MDISKAQIENILKTLPIGYYLHYNVNVELTDECYSNHNALTDEIHISYTQLANIFKSVNENDVDPETFVRTMLYHEVGHAILTPRFCTGDRIMNVFEDERLETLLENYFLNVEFKKMIKLAAHYDPNSTPQTVDEMFFEVVRFRKGPKKFVDRVAEIITTYSNATKNDCSYSYLVDVHALYNEIKAYMNTDENSQSQKQQKADIDASGTVQNDKIQLDDFGLKMKAQQALSNELAYADNTDISEQLAQIFSSFKTTETRLGTAVQARSGVFDPRSVVRDDYKWWVQKNRQGNVKAFAKLKLNLFIDCSGSFSDNDKITNALLKALIKLEKVNPDFQFDLIRCGRGEQLCPKHKRVQESNSGTQISQNIETLYHQVQQRCWKNVNICLYDGDFCLDAHKMKDKIIDAKPISVFNNKDSVCIFDTDNKVYAETYLKNCKVVISNNYTAELIKHVMAALQSLCRI